MIDVDFKNAFPSIEWVAIREAIKDSLPELSDWCCWCHETPSRIMLPCGAIRVCDRGAEQGDPLGPIYCAVVLGHVMEKARLPLEGDGITLSDVWYLDDGQIFCDPSDADSILRTSDDESSKVGLERGRGN